MALRANALPVVLSLAVGGCGAGSALETGGPVTSLASIVEHKGSVPNEPVMKAKLNVGSVVETGSLAAAPKPPPRGRPGQFAAIQSAGGLGWVRDAAVEDYLKRLVQRLQRGLPQARPVQVFISATSGYHAYATPDDEIVVSVGFLSKAKSEGEIAAMLAHELSHLLLVHYERELSTRKLLDATGMATNAAVFAAVASEMRRDRSQAGHHYSLADERAARSKMFKSIRAGQFAVTFFDDIVGTHYAREQEFEADMLGTDLLMRSGYQPVEMKRMLEYMLAEWEKQEKQKKTIAERFGDHVGQTVTTSAVGVLAGFSGKSLGEYVRDGLAEFAIAEVGKAYTSSHPTPGARLQLSSGYIEKHHATAGGEGTGDAEFRRIMRARGWLALVDGYEKLFSAMQRRQEEKLDEALAEAQLALKGPLAHDPGARLLAYQIMLELSQHEPAYGVLKGARLGAIAPIGYYAALAWEHAVRGRLDEAFTLIAKGEQHYGDAKLFLPTRLRLLKRFGQPEQVETAFRTCMQGAPEELQKACESAAVGGDGEIADSRQGKGLLEQGKNSAGQHGAGALLKGMGIKLPGPLF